MRPNAEVVQLFHTDPSGYFGPEAALTYRTNSRGFRGPEFLVEKPVDTFRVLVLGDSFTFGAGVRERDTFVARLRSQLRATAGDTLFEVLNLGVMGFDIADEANLLRTLAVDYQPDLVLFCIFLNDAGGGGAHQAFNAAQPEWNLPGWRRTLRSVDRLMAIVERGRAVRELADSYEESFAPESTDWLEARRELRAVRDLGRATPFGLAFVIFPVLWQLSDDYPFAASHRRIAAFAREIDVPLLDLLGAFAGHDGPELWAHPSNQHPNATAHALAADAIRGFLEAEALLAPSG
jgi:lysophospholipase L1-like esterase